MNRKVFVKILLSIIAIAILIPFYAFADPVLINLSPNRGRIGSSVTATVRYLDLQSQEQNRVFINGVLAPVRRVYGVTGSEDLGKVLFFIPPNVISEPNTSPITLQVTVEVDGVQSNSLDYTLYPSPMITDVDPANGLQGEQKNVTIKVANVRLRSRGLRVDFGDGIQVSNVDVTSPNTILVSITIADDAEPGLRDVTIRMGRGRLKKIGGFTVSAPATAAGLRLDVNRVTSPVFSKSVVISGTVNKGTGGGSNATTPEVPPIITAILPSSGAQGQELILEIKGQNTHFSANSTQLSFGPGIEVLEANVTSQTSIIARIKIDSSASTGGRHVIAVSGAEEATSVLAFNVVAGSLTITGKVVDENGNPIPGAEVSIKGYNLKTKTDPSGTFTIINVPAGDQTLVINARNFASTEYKISGENGQTLDFASVPIRLERKAAPPSSTNTPTLLSVLSQGANRLIAPTSIEETKQLIINSIISVGGREIGVMDANGTQMNPQIDGEGIVSLTDSGLENMAKKWAIGREIFRLSDAFFFFNSVVSWNPSPPDYKTWLDVFNRGLETIWNDPSAPGNSLFVLVFNKGSVVSSQPPKLSIDTTLNPLQMFLLVNSFMTYIEETYSSNNTAQQNASALMVANLDEQYRGILSDSNNQFIMLADNDDNSNGQSGTVYYDIGTTWHEVIHPALADYATGYIDNSLIEMAFDIYTSYIDKDLQRAFLIEGVEKTYSIWNTRADIVKGVISGMAGKAVQYLYKPILDKFKNSLIRYGAPEPPRIISILSIKTKFGVDNILIFEPSPGDRQQTTLPRFYYEISRKDSSSKVTKIVKPSSFFKKTEDGHLFYVDHSPPPGGVSYFLRSYIRRSRYVPMSMTWGNNIAWSFLSASLPAGANVLNALQDVLTMADEIYHGLIFQKSDMIGPYSLVVNPQPTNDHNIDIVVDPEHGKEYVSIGSLGYIYVNGPNGWSPIINTYFAKPHNKGLAIDSNGWLFTENAASEDQFGGRIFGFKDPFRITPGQIHTTEDRYLVGTVNYYSPVLHYANPVSLIDMTMGDWYNYFKSSYLNLGASLPNDTNPGALMDAANSILATGGRGGGANSSSSAGPDIDSESIGILNFADQSFKVLDRRYGEPAPQWPERNVAHTICRFNHEIEADSHIRQHPLYSGLSFVNSGDNVYFFDDFWLCGNSHRLFSNDSGELPFAHISDIFLDNTGNLFLSDSERGKLYVVRADLVLRGSIGPSDICVLPYNFNHPFTIEGSADEEDLLVADYNGIHKVPLLVPYSIASNEIALFNASTILTEKDGAISPVYYCNGSRDRILLPKPDDSKPVKLILKPNNPDKGDEIIKVSSDSTQICYLEPPNSSTSDNVTIEWGDPKHFDFNMQLSQEDAGKLIVRSIELPVARLVRHDEVTNAPDAVLTPNIVIPHIVDRPCGETSPIVLFAPKTVKSTAQTVDIRGMVTDSSISNVIVKDDSGHVKMGPVNGGQFDANVTVHQGRIKIEIIAKSGDRHWLVTRYVDTDSSDYATVAGIVVDIVTKIPISFARIEIPEFGIETFTDDKGYFSIKVPVNNNFTLRVHQ